MGGGQSRVYSKGVVCLKEGDNVPNVVIKARIRTAPTEDVTSFVWKDIMTGDLFKGKRIVLFSIPGGKHNLIFFFSLLKFWF